MLVPAVAYVQNKDFNGTLDARLLQIETADAGVMRNTLGWIREVGRT